MSFFGLKNKDTNDILCLETDEFSTREELKWSNAE